MSETPWTEGPWFVERDFDIRAPDGNDTPWHVALAMADCGTVNEGKANARLCAAAPELYAALMECADDLEAEIEARYPPAIREYPGEKRRYDRDIAVVHRARAALAKARGET